MGTGHDHKHHHHHGDHHEHSHEPNTIFKIGIALNLCFAAVEFAFGFSVDSLALISDATHNLTDVFGLAVAWAGYYLTNRLQKKKFSLYSAMFNSGALIVGSLLIIYEAIERLRTPPLPVAKTVIIVSLVGFFINYFSAKLFHHEHHHDMNMKSAYLHLMADAGISISVAGSGVLMMVFDVPWVDAALSILISLYMVVSGSRVLVEAYRRLAE